MMRKSRGKHIEEKENSAARIVGLSVAGVSVATAAVALGTVGTALAADVTDAEQPAEPTVPVAEQPAAETHPEVQPVAEPTEDEKDEAAAKQADASAEATEKTAAEVKTNEVDTATEARDAAAKKAADADAAVKDADSKVSDATNADTIIADENAKIAAAQADSAKATTEKTAADDAVAKATTAFENAQKEAGTNKADADAAVAKAQAAVDAAKKTVDDASKFDQNKVNSGVIGLLEWLRDNKKIDEATANTLIARANQYVTESKANGINLDFSNPQDPGSLEMLKKSLEFYPYVNRLRAGEGQSELKVDLATLIDEIWNLKWGGPNGNHASNAGVAKSATGSWENLAWAPGTPSANTAFSGWYDSEKAVFDAYVKLHPEYEVHRHDSYVVAVPSFAENPDPNGDTTVGHYLNLVKSDHKAFAIAVSQFPGNNLGGILADWNGRFSTIAAEGFAGTSRPSDAQLSVADFTSLVNQYYDAVYHPQATDAQKKALTDAQAALSAAQQKQADVDKVVSAAQADLKSAQDAQAAVQKRIDDAAATVAASQARIASVQALSGQLNALTAAAATAHTAADAAHAELTAAQGVYDAAYVKWQGLLAQAASFRSEAAAHRQAITDRAAAAAARAAAEQAAREGAAQSVAVAGMAAGADGRPVAARTAMYGTRLAQTGVSVEALAASSLVALMLGVSMAKRREE